MMKKVDRRVTSKRQAPPWLHTLMTIVITAAITWTSASLLYCHSATSPEAASQQPADRYSREAAPRIKSETVEKKMPNKLQATYPPYDGPSRVFPKFEHPFPCFPGDTRLMLEDPASEGILFQRPHKTGSTTMVGIVMRLAHNRAKGILDRTKGVKHQRCSHRAMHGTAQKMQYGSRDKTKSFLFSIIRDPTKRIISEFFHFEVTAFQKDPTDDRFLLKARAPTTYNYYLKELSTRPDAVTPGNEPSVRDFALARGFTSYIEMMAQVRAQVPGTELLNREVQWYKQHGPNFNGEKMVADILDDYNFIAVMERMDESLVAFQMLFGLTTQEILYTRARSSGSFSNGWVDRPCFYIMPSFLTDGMKAYFESEEWQNAIKYDMMMFQAANKSLDRTIEALGRDEFSKNLAEFKRGLKLAQENCKGRIRTMCSEGGKVIPLPNRTCYIWAEGCDHACIDDLKL